MNRFLSSRPAYANTALTDEQLYRTAPSVFATEPWHKMSEKYTFIPTIDIVRKMRSEGFQPYQAMQSRTRIAGKSDFTRHMIRFRDVRQGTDPAMRQLGQVYPELVLTNSHDGASAYKMDAGLFRLVCLNGMMVSEGQIGQMNVRHTGSADGIIEASYEIVEQFPQVLESVEAFSRLRLNPPQQRAIAAAAVELRYDDTDTAPPVTPEQALRPHRVEDREPSLWNTFNTLQENLTQGGIRTRNATGRRMTTRPVTGIAENTKLNKALWTLTEKMRELMS